MGARGDGSRDDGRPRRVAANRDGVGRRGRRIASHAPAFQARRRRAAGERHAMDVVDSHRRSLRSDLVRAPRAHGEWPAERHVAQSSQQRGFHPRSGTRSSSACFISGSRFRTQADFRRDGRSATRKPARGSGRGAPRGFRLSTSRNRRGAPEPLGYLTRSRAPAASFGSHNTSAAPCT